MHATRPAVARTVAALALAVVAACGREAPAPTPRNLVPAGGAEDDPRASGWRVYTSSPDVLAGTTAYEVRSGRQAFVVESGADDGSGCWYAVLPDLDPATRYRFQGFARLEPARAAAARLQVEAWRGRRGPQLLGSAQLAAGDTVWTNLAGSFTPPRGVEVRLAACLEGAGAAFFDDLALWREDRPPVVLEIAAPAGDPTLLDGPGQLALALEVHSPAPLPPDLRTTVHWRHETGPTHRLERPLDGASSLQVPLETAGLWQVTAEVRTGEELLDRVERWVGVGLGFASGAFAATSARAGPAPQAATGAFRVARVEERFYFVDPDGRPFLSLGVGQVLPHAEPGSRYTETVRTAYGGEAHWALEARRRLAAGNWNTVGAMSSPRIPGLPYTVQLDLGRLGTPLRMAEVRADLPEWLYFPDVFDPAFAPRVERLCRHLVPARHDPLLLGYFTDNELGWWGLYAHTLRLPPDAPARRELERFLATSPPEPVELAWERHVAERYLSVVAAAIRRRDPQALVLGHRWAGLVPEHLLDIVGRHCDVVAVNYYNDGVPHALTPELGHGLLEQGRGAGRPVLVTEWSYRGADTGHPNFGGAAPVLPTQGDRATAAAVTATALLANPWVVGYHWFRWVDLPAAGVDQGGAREDGNYGLIAEDDRPWRAVQAALAEVNGAAYGLAAHARLGGGVAASWSQPDSLHAAVAAGVPRLEAAWARPVLQRVADLIAELVPPPAVPEVVMVPPTEGSALHAVVRPALAGTLELLQPAAAARLVPVTGAGAAVAPFPTVRELAPGAHELRWRLVPAAAGAARALVLAPAAAWTGDGGASIDGATGAPAPPSLRLERTRTGGAGWHAPSVPVRPGERLWLAGRFRGAAIARGHATYFHRAVVAVEFVDRLGRRVWHQDLLRADGTFDWRFAAYPFLVPPGAAAARVHVQLIETTGTFWADDLALAVEPMGARSAPDPS